MMQGRGIRRWQATAVIVASVLTLLALGAGSIHAAGTDNRPPGGVLTDPLVRELDIAAPAIVRIVTIYDARITLSPCGKKVTLPGADSTYTLGASGTGSFISAHGDILTADHVVHSPKEDLDFAIFSEQESATDIANAVDAACGATVQVTAADVEAGFIQASGIPYTTSYSEPETTVYRSTQYTGPYADSSSNNGSFLRGVPGYKATVTQSSSFNDDDVALIHVPLDDTPSIAFDPTASLGPDDRLAIIGYPGNGDLNDNPTNLLTPSVNTIYVSAIKANDNGSPLIQVGGNVEHGDSGGPALDVDGRIVGVVSFSYVDGNNPGSTAFLRASDSALKLVQAGDVDTTPGTFQNLWRQAFTDYAASYDGHWHKAAQEMDALGQQYPDFKALQTYQSYADTAASTETVGLISTQNTGLLAIVGGAAVLVVILLILIAVLLVRRRRQRAKAAAHPAYAPFSYYGYGYNYPQQYNPQQYNPQQYGNGWPAQPTAGTGTPPSGYQSPASGYQSPASGYPSQYGYPADPTQPRSAQYPGYGSQAPANGSQGSYGSQGAQAGQSAQSEHEVATADGSPRNPPQSQPVSAYCVNGHPMAANATRCPICGAVPYAPTARVTETHSQSW